MGPCRETSWLLTWVLCRGGLGTRERGLARRIVGLARRRETCDAALRGGFYADRVTARGIEVARRVADLAAEIDLTPAQFAVLWCKDQPGITAPLVGPRTLEQLEQLIPLLEMELPSELGDACDELVPPGSAIADFHNTADWMKMTV